MIITLATVMYVSAWAKEGIISLYAERLRKPEYLIETIVNTVDVYSETYNLDPWLVLGVIEVESAGDPFAVSHKRAKGLMQIIPRTGREIAEQLGEEWTGSDSLFDIDRNIRYGTFYLRQLLDEFLEIHIALTAYFWGPERVRNWIKNGRPLPLTYANKVLRAASVYDGD